jgi:hypothetical protein
MSPDGAAGRRLDLELVAAVVLATAALGSAWSAYQATRWSGVQSIAFDRASAQRDESLRASQRGFQQALVDVTTFVAWANARSQGNLRLADFLRERFRREFVAAFESWRGAQAPGVEIPLGTPFDRPEYRPAALREAERLTNEAAVSATAARHANQLADNFVFSVVLFTTSVFFGGIQTKTDLPWLRRTLLGLSTVILLFAILFMLRLPQNVGF